MSKQVFFEDVEVGAEITPLRKHPTSRQLVKWAGASEDYNEIHYDKDFALKTGLPGTIVHGRLKTAFLTQMVTDWIGERGTLVKISTSFRGMDQPREDLVCRGKVTGKHTEKGKHFVDCEIWLENSKQEQTTTGTAQVALPSREGEK